MAVGGDEKEREVPEWVCCENAGVLFACALIIFSQKHLGAAESICDVFPEERTPGKGEQLVGKEVPEAHCTSLHGIHKT